VALRDQDHGDRSAVDMVAGRAVNSGFIEPCQPSLAARPSGPLRVHETARWLSLMVRRMARGLVLHAQRL
jgi:hypothetical protein